jgi:hypothetical protein
MRRASLAAMHFEICDSESYVARCHSTQRNARGKFDSRTITGRHAHARDTQDTNDARSKTFSRADHGIREFALSLVISY